MNEVKTNESKQTGDTIVNIDFPKKDFENILEYFLVSLNVSICRPVNINLNILGFSSLPVEATSLPVEANFNLGNTREIYEFIKYFSTFKYCDGTLKIKSEGQFKDIVINFKIALKKLELTSSINLKLSSLSFILYSITDAALKNIFTYNGELFSACNIKYVLKTTFECRYYNFHCSKYTCQSSPHHILFLKNFETFSTDFKPKELEKLKQCNLYYNIENIEEIKLVFELGYGKYIDINIKLL